MIDTTKLRELAKKATPGPWTQWEGRGWVHAGTPEANEKGYMAGTYGQVCRTDCGDFSDAQEIKNAEYIAAANPATVLALLDELDRTKGSVAIAGAALSALDLALKREQPVDLSTSARNAVTRCVIEWNRALYVINVQTLVYVCQRTDAIISKYVNEDQAA